MPQTQTTTPIRCAQSSGWTLSARARIREGLRERIARRRRARPVLVALV
jgi:hypothetical protein